MAGFGISGIEPSSSDTRQLISKMDLLEIVCEVGKWMEPAQDRVQWQVLVLAVLNLLVLLPETFLTAVRITILQVPYTHRAIKRAVLLARTSGINPSPS